MNRTTYTSNQQRWREARLILDEVRVRPLRAVEQVFLLGLWAGRRAGRVLGRVESVGVGVEDAGCFAEGAGAEAVPDGEEEAGGGGEEDVAWVKGGRLVRLV